MIGTTGVTTCITGGRGVEDGRDRKRGNAENREQGIVEQGTVELFLLLLFLFETVSKEKVLLLLNPTSLYAREQHLPRQKRGQKYVHAT